MDIQKDYIAILERNNKNLTKTFREVMATCANYSKRVTELQEENEALTKKVEKLQPSFCVTKEALEDLEEKE